MFPFANNIIQDQDMLYREKEKAYHSRICALTTTAQKYDMTPSALALNFFLIES